MKDRAGCLGLDPVPLGEQDQPQGGLGYARGDGGDVHRPSGTGKFAQFLRRSAAIAEKIAARLCPGRDRDTQCNERAKPRKRTQH